MKKLINGIIQFRQTSLEDYRAKFAKLASRQNPDALMIACCDSRVVPNVFASSDPGDLLVFRNVGNLVPIYKNKHLDDTSVAAVIEFSLVSLNISNIIVCGHSECGAMQTILTHGSQHNSCSALDQWLEKASLSNAKLQSTLLNNGDTFEPCDLLSQVNVLQQLDNLKAYPLVSSRIKNNTLKIHGWWFNLLTADVYYYNDALDKFIIINEEEAENIITSL